MLGNAAKAVLSVGAGKIEIDKIQKQESEKKAERKTGEKCSSQKRTGGQGRKETGSKPARGKMMRLSRKKEPS